MRWGAFLFTLGAALAAVTLAFAQPVPRPKPGDDALGRLMRDSETSLRLNEARKAAPVILGVQVIDYADRTRIMIEVSDPLILRVFTLASPNRVVMDMRQVIWRLQGSPPPSARSAVRSFRYGLFRPGNSRFVIDLNRAVTATTPVALAPSEGYGYRIVVDLLPTSQNKFTVASGWPADLRAREAAVERKSFDTARVQARAAGNKKIIVLDAGHGGIDTGTSGVTGLDEKDLVLDMAKRVRKVLQGYGAYSVYLTRDDDTYIPLRQRVRIARNSAADLFVSIHADSNPQPSVYGASVYTLSESGSDKEAAALAAKENQSDIIAGVDLSEQDTPVASILIDLAQRDTLNRSSRFAESVVTHLRSATDILPRQPHRSAAFAVLKAPDVPAVLIELGYLSNASDARKMGTTAWRDGVAHAIARAIDRNFSATRRTITAGQGASD
ncbi:MAG TPA: N-acetylmuramoyl-L-alanine amidase [Rhizomicrobium sp.]|nr:N-acetylmuramoyl-L-alanine amidase [Rhizomicrobium sp.]